MSNSRAKGLKKIRSFNVHSLYWCVALCIRWMDREIGWLSKPNVWTLSNKCMATRHSSASWENLGAPVSYEYETV